MKLAKYIAALLLIGLLAVPAYAETVAETMFDGIVDATMITVPTSDAGAQVETGTLPESTTMAVVVISANLDPETTTLATDETLPREALLRGAQPPLDYVQNNFLSLAALSLAALAFVLAVVALARTGKKGGHGRRKNYF